MHPASHAPVPVEWRDVDERGTLGLLTGRRGNVNRVGGFLGFVRLTTRTMHPRGAYVRAGGQTELN